MVGCGPFTASDNLSYESLKDLLDLVKRDRPHALFLFGPFLDQLNQVIFSGETYYEITPGNIEFVDYESLFADLVSMIQKELVDCTSTEVFLIPSPKDIHHAYPLP